MFTDRQTFSAFCNMTPVGPVQCSMAQGKGCRTKLCLWSHKSLRRQHNQTLPTCSSLIHIVREPSTATATEPAGNTSASFMQQESPDLDSLYIANLLAIIFQSFQIHLHLLSPASPCTKQLNFHRHVAQTVPG